MTDSMIARAPQSRTPAAAAAPRRHQKEALSSGPHIPGLDAPKATTLADADGVVTHELPAFDTTDPAQLEAWFGNFGHAEHFRKVVLANCREIERAKATAAEQKVSEARLDDLARTSSTYVQFLIDGLHGRTLRERNVLDSRAA